MAPSAVDANWGALVETLPATLIATARGLTWHLGLTDVHGGSWHEYTRFEAMYDMPRMVTAQPGMELSRFRVAHHRAGFFGLAIDRLADGQVRSPALVAPLVEPLRNAWIDALAAALNDREAAVRDVDLVVERWREGLAREQALRSRSCLAADEYAALVADKCAWLTLCAVLFARRQVEPDAARHFERAVVLMAVSLQAIDDGLDSGEDLRDRDTSVPRWLGVSATALVKAGALTLQTAEREARAGRFARLARWLKHHSEAVLRHVVARGTPLDAIAALSVSMALNEVCDSLESSSVFSPKPR